MEQLRFQLISAVFYAFSLPVAVRKENINIMFFEILSAVHVILFHSGIAQWDIRIDICLLTSCLKRAVKK